MKPITIRNLSIGKGRPKICIPIIASDKEEILAAAKEIIQLPADLIEWRADWYEDAYHPEKVLELASQMRQILGNLPFLFTFRTEREGGEKSITPEDYLNLNLVMAESGYIDLLDVELFTGETAVTQIIQKAHENQVRVMLSNHDFFKTPPKEELEGRLKKMHQLGGDILKLAMMPQSKRDLLTLLEVTLEMSEAIADCPIVTMSMGSMGVISRLAGETFGSAITFGAAKQRSAPGQVEVRELTEALEIIHRNQNF